jgi:hypothetical protein
MVDQGGQPVLERPSLVARVVGMPHAQVTVCP